MIVLYILSSILFLLAILLLLRVRLTIEYSENGIISDLRIGPVNIRLFPRKEKEKVRKKKPGKKREPKAAPTEKRGGRLSEFKKYWEYISKVIQRLKHKLRVDNLTVYFAAGGSDPVAVAMSYGGVTAAMGMIIPVLEQNLEIKDRDFETSFSFELEEPYIFLRAKISAAVWEIIYFAQPIISEYMKSKDKKE